MGQWSERAVERVLSVVQGFDPVGVAARDLRECLRLQIRSLGLEDTPTEVIVRDHLGLLEQQGVSGLARHLDLPARIHAGNHDLRSLLAPKLTRRIEIRSFDCGSLDRSKVPKHREDPAEGTQVPLTLSALERFRARDDVEPDRLLTLKSLLDGFLGH